MRTTVTIDDQLLARAKARAREDDTTLGEVVVASLQEYLVRPAVREVPVLPVSPHGGGLAPGIDPSSNASLFAAADEEEDEEIRRQFR